MFTNEFRVTRVLVFGASLGVLLPTGSRPAQEPEPAKTSYHWGVDEPAGNLFTKVARDPLDLVARRQLAERYRRLGYQRAAETYELSIVFLETGKCDSMARPVPNRWLCRSPIPDLASVEAEIGRRLTPTDSRAAVELADRVLKEKGPLCELLSEWSRAVLFDAMARSGSRDHSAEEQSVRHLLTLGDEANVFPSGLEGAAAVYGFLAGYYSLSEDYITAFVLTKTAGARLQEGSLTGSEERGSFSNRLDREAVQLERLAQMMRRRKDAKS